MMIVVPDGIRRIDVYRNFISITGDLGTMARSFHKFIILQLNDDGNISLLFNSDRKKIRSRYMEKILMGTTYSLIYGMIIGVTVGFVKKLQLIGVGYRVSVINNVVNLMLGLSHVVSYKIPEGIQIVCSSQTDVIVKGIDKQLVGQVAANLRALHPPEPFKGKGIRYLDEIIHYKDTKKR